MGYVFSKKYRLFGVTLFKVPSMRFLLTSLLSFLFVSITHAQESHLVISHGGGVAGTATVYKISVDGEVLKGKGLGEISYTERSKLKKCSVKKYMKQAKSLMASYPDSNHPGNIYFSIALLESGNEKKITWGASDFTVPEEAERLYKTITGKLTTLTFTSNPGK
jgi:hypothetical protein